MCIQGQVHHTLSFCIRVILSLLAAITFTCLQHSMVVAQDIALISPYWNTVVKTGDYTPDHKAIDFGLYYQQVIAATDGTLYTARWFNDTCHQSNTNSACGYGLYVRIDYNGYRTIYAHLSATAFDLDASGISIQRGQVIGMSGHTGWSTAPHLHFELQDQSGNGLNPFENNRWQDGQWANPSRPIPQPIFNPPIVIDDTTDNTAGFIKGYGGYPNSACTGDCGGWTSAWIGVGNHMYYAVQSPYANRWARWQPSLPHNDGIYEIQVHVPNANATTWQAPYVIVHADGESRGRVDQFGLYDQWVSLGIYRLNQNSYIWAHDGTGDGKPGDPFMHCGGACRLGVDAVRFIETGVLYAPDIRYNGSWTSALTLHNNGGGPAKTLVKFLDENGNVLDVCKWASTLAAHQSTTLSCTNGQVASAVVNASQDVVASVLQRRYFPSSSASYTGIDKPANFIDVPLVQNNNSGWQSELFLQNTSRVLTYATVTFTGRGGSQCTHFVDNIPPNGRRKLVIAQLGCTVDTILSASINAAQPLAVAATQYDNGQYRFMETEHLGGASTILYAPLIQNNNSGWVSGLSLMNTSGGNATAWTSYYTAGGGQPCTDPWYTLYPRQPKPIYPLPLPGTGCAPYTTLNVRFSSDQSIAANVNQLLSSGYGASTYAAANVISSTVVLPRLFRSGGWNDALSVYNPNGQTTTVTVRFYTTSGVLNSQVVFSLAAYGHSTLFAPASFVGSALVIDNEGLPIAASANNYLPTANSDDIGAYLGRPR